MNPSSSFLQLLRNASHHPHTFSTPRGPPLACGSLGRLRRFSSGSQPRPSCCAHRKLRPSSHTIAQARTSSVVNFVNCGIGFCRRDDGHRLLFRATSCVIPLHWTQIIGSRRRGAAFIATSVAGATAGRWICFARRPAVVGGRVCRGPTYLIADCWVSRQPSLLVRFGSVLQFVVWLHMPPVVGLVHPQFSSYRHSLLASFFALSGGTGGLLQLICDGITSH